MVTVSDRVLVAWRRAICGVVAFDVVVAALKSHFRPAFDAGTAPPLGAATTPLLVVLTLAALVALGSYARSRAPWAHGAAAFAAVRAVFFVYEHTYEAGHEDFVQAGTAFLGWIFGHGLAQAARAPRSGDDAHAAVASRMAATGMLAAIATTYVSAGLSKLVESRGTWVESETLRLMILSHYEYGMDGPLDGLRRWAGESPRLCATLSAGTLVIQLGAPTLLGPPRARTIWATFLIAFHVGIWLGSRILFVQVLAVLLTLAVPWDRLARTRPAPTPVPHVGEVLDERRLGMALLAFLATSAVVVGLGWTLGIGWA